jgi:hypothetical protein
MQLMLNLGARMLRSIFTAYILLGSLCAQGAQNPELDKSLKDSALMYGAYGDESVICGGDLLSYQVVSEAPDEVAVKALITEQVNYCASVIQVECHAVYIKKENSYIQKSFVCDEGP